MIKHIVAWKIKPALGRTKEENMQLLKRRLEELPSLIPEIVRMSANINSPLAKPDNYDIIIEAEFENMEALKRYSDHPAHLALIDLLSEIRTEKAAVDYEF